MTLEEVTIAVHEQQLERRHTDLVPFGVMGAHCTHPLLETDTLGTYDKAKRACHAAYLVEPLSASTSLRLTSEAPS